jgi:hypothetical protein
MGFVWQATAYRARLLSRVLIELGPDYGLDLPHASDVSQACVHAYGPSNERSIIPVTELLGVLGAYQWRLHGVWVPALGQTIHPHYGVFAPTRQEYLDLVAAAPWPRVKTAFDIGTGTGVIAALLAHRGAEQVVATDIEARAVACARDNVTASASPTRSRLNRQTCFRPGVRTWSYAIRRGCRPFPPRHSMPRSTTQPRAWCVASFRDCPIT